MHTPEINYKHSNILLLVHRYVHSYTYVQLQVYKYERSELHTLMHAANCIHERTFTNHPTYTYVRRNPDTPVKNTHIFIYAYKRAQKNVR